MTLHPPTTDSGAGDASHDRMLLVIAPERFVRRLESIAAGPVERSENIFDAVGEMLLGKPTREAVTLVVTSEQLRGSPEATVATLRTLAPSMRIVALTATANGAQRAGPHPLEGIVDVVLHEPVSDAELRAAIGEEERAGAGSAASAAEEAESAKPQATVEAPSSSQDLPAPAPLHAEPIGDTDLIQEIMFGPEGITAPALALIRQQTGWTDIELVSAEREHAAAIKFAGDHFGWLVAPDGNAQALREWAGWLGRWLALDRAYREYRQLTFRDDLTGAWNRRFFDTFLTQCIRQAGERRRPITVMVFDLDHFKRYNDEFGHEAGDEILRETVRLLHSVIRKGDRVCRIGGDEFAVVFADLEGPREPGSQHPETVEEIASRFQDQISQLKFPKLGTEAPGTLSISAGLATYPWDGTNSSELLRKADELALQSKRRGKNVMTFGPGAAEACKRHPGETSSPD